MEGELPLPISEPAKGGLIVKAPEEGKVVQMDERHIGLVLKYRGGE
jgi:hypothetical protein